ncbi:uncharacterized protein BO66DRAFT_433822 [Aspergillus aculeatinus CBS 121060]|uniref:Uncharacterized protein n=1 Tax=Aspergillus aculeatinus CBS 121060 TaxID=1448322 RepID=A0ACD1HMR3_9EURO|nr:hypothetical protein BO66DRAFT_433822 [Aspergillus aculeatinus CBS 121060]RAH74710.1 hypothetical protein BO66DRAFT_433822 [Aspergillus aculeatinus CBS 121060]
MASLIQTSVQLGIEPTEILLTWVNKIYKQSPTWTNAYFYLASPDYRARTKSTKYTFDFALRWMDPTTGGTSGLYDDFAMVPASYDRFAVSNATTTGTTGQNVTKLYRRANLAAVQDTLVLELAGYIDLFVLHSQPTANTLIALTSLYRGPAKQPVFTFTPAALQSLLQNITLSLLTLHQTTTTTTATNTITVNVHRFPHPAGLFTPYFVALAMAGRPRARAERHLGEHDGLVPDAVCDARE